MTIFTHKPTLTGKHTILRPFTETDIETMLEILQEEELAKLTGSVGSTQQAEEPMSQKEKIYTTEWYRTRGTQEDRIDLGIVCKKTGELVGEAVLNEWDENGRCCNFRILIGKNGRDRGLGSEATLLLRDYAFDILALHRIELTVFEFNPRAIHVYEKCGFIYEGTRRDTLCYDGKWYDERIYSILETDKRK